MEAYPETNSLVLGAELGVVHPIVRRHLAQIGKENSGVGSQPMI